MKLRNKKTGEIKDFALVVANGDVDDISLADLTEEWEDYEEPKEIYYINYKGNIMSACPDGNWQDEKQIGNYFETKEEAEKAVEKLKAWKRLREKGFKFTYWNGGARQINFEIRSLENEYYIPRQICDDLDLLFGGEE